MHLPYSSPPGRRAVAGTFVAAALPGRAALAIFRGRRQHIVSRLITWQVAVAARCRDCSWMLPSPSDPSAEDVLIAVARTLTSRLDVAGVAVAVLDGVHAVFGATSSWVLLQEPRARQLRTVAVRGDGADAFQNLVMPVDAGIMGLAFTSRRVVFVPDAQEDRRWFDPARVQRTRLASVFAVPLVVHERAVGVVGLDAPRFTRSRPPEARDIARLEAFAAQAAIGIANAQLYEATERDRRRLAALLDERRGLRRRVEHLQEEVRAHEPSDLIGDSPPWREVVRLADMVAAGDTTVLLLGETGSGKEVLARRIHQRSPRGHGPFVPVNCAALPEPLVESALFGHEKGAFTGAVARKAGKFEVADGGTLFLDEIGDLPLDAQAKLLRILQDSKVERVGGTQPVEVDVRLVAATNQYLESAVAAGTYRSDLYFRFSVFPITLPPLRERASDVAVFARHFVGQFARRLRRPARELADDALQRLLEYHWPGNVRELQNVIERAVILTPGAVVSSDAIWLPKPTPPAAPGADAAGVTTLADADRRAILAALELASWRISGAGGAAERLGTKPTTLHAKMKKLGIRRPPRRDVAR
jgi:formate hydrogenlyase transcriptional activator